jgi:hypothetical protein
MKKLVALAIVAAVVAVFKLLPWWAGVGLVVVLGISAKLLIGTVFKRFFLGMFETKSAALRGASARLHAITEAPEPKPDFDDDFDDEDDEDPIERTPRLWRYIDVSIDVPERSADSDQCGMTMWEPGELMIVEPSAKAGKATDLEGFDDDLGEVHSVDVMQGGSWVALDGDKVLGSQRLRLHVGVRPGVDEFKLRYYFEILKNAGMEPA